MNPFDPALEESVNKLVSGIQSASTQCMAVPQVAQAVGMLSSHAAMFFGDQRTRFLGAVLGGNGPMAKIKRMVEPHAQRSYYWDLIRLEPIAHSCVKPLWVQNHAFTEYVRYVNKRRAGDDSVGYHDMAYITVPVTCGMVKLLCLKRQIALSQANDTGLVSLEYSVPSMQFRDFRISSTLEELPSLKQDAAYGQIGQVAFNFQYDKFWDHHYTTATFLKDREYKPGLFRGVVLTDKEYRDPIEVRLHEFLMVEDEYGVRFVDGVITLKPIAWQPCGYCVSFSREMQCVLGLSSGDLEWTQVPQVYQALLVQVPLVENESIGVEVTFDSDYTPLATILNRRSLDVEICEQ
jgi:hypothetical protein